MLTNLMAEATGSNGGGGLLPSPACQRRRRHGH